MFLYNIVDFNEYLKPLTENKILRKEVEISKKAKTKNNKIAKKKKNISQKNQNFLKSMGLKLKQ